MPKDQEKQQGTIDSFFGIKGAKKQTSLNGFFKKKEANDKENTENATKKPMNVANKRRQHAILDDSSDEEAEQKKSSSPVKKAKIEGKKEDNDNSKDKKPVANSEAKKESDDKTDDMEIDTPKKTSPAKKSIETKKKPSSKPAAPKDDTTNDTNVDNKMLNKAAKKLAKAASVDVDVEEIKSPVPYVELAKIFEEIEATTKRLEIQAILTKLIRRILKYCPQELHSIIYLASNSIAPAYDCVELGIGDSILEGAVAQAYGTSPSKFSPLLFTQLLIDCPSW